MASSTPLQESVSNLADRVASSADGAIQATRAVADQTLERLSGTVATARDKASPWVDKAAVRADEASRYVQAQPVKALLMAAAAGALLATLLSWTRGSSR